MATLLFPDMAAWVRHVDSRKDWIELNTAVDVLRSARHKTGIHNFIPKNQMGIAWEHLNRRAEELDCYYLRSAGNFRKQPSTHKISNNRA